MPVIFTLSINDQIHPKYLSDAAQLKRRSMYGLGIGVVVACSVIIAEKDHGHAGTR